jgi:hypothetical protein
MKYKKLSSYIIVFSLFALGIVITFFPFFQSGLDLIAGDYGDARFVNFLLEHSYQWLHSKTLQLSDLALFYPAQNTLFYSETMIGVYPFYWFFRELGCDPYLSLEYFIIFCFAGNYFSFYFFSRKLKIDNFFATWGAFLFAFAIPRLAQLCHIQLLPQFMSIISLYYFIKYIETRSLINLIGCVFAMVWQFYASWYLGWFLLFFYAIFLVFVLLKRKKYFEKIKFFLEKKNHFIFCGILALLLISPLVFNYFKIFIEMGGRDYEEARALAPTLSSWFLMPPDHWQVNVLWFLKFIKPDGTGPEKMLFMGLFTSLIFGYTLFISIKNKKNYILVSLIIIMFFLVTRFWEFHLWRLVYSIFPAAKSIRALGRIILLIIPLLLFLSMNVLQTQVQRLSSKKKGLLIVFLILSLTEQLYPTAHTWRRSEFAAHHEELAKATPDDCKVIFFATSGKEDFIHLNIDAMWVSLLKNINTVNGYSGMHPKNYSDDLQRAQLGANQELLPQLTQNLSQWLKSENSDSSVCLLNVDSRKLISRVHP